MIDHVEALLAARVIHGGGVDDADELAGGVVAQKVATLTMSAAFAVTVSSP